MVSIPKNDWVIKKEMRTNLKTVAIDNVNTSTPVPSAPVNSQIWVYGHETLKTLGLLGVPAVNDGVDGKKAHF